MTTPDAGGELLAYRYHNGVLHVTPPHFLRYQRFAAELAAGRIVAVIRWAGWCNDARDLGHVDNGSHPVARVYYDSKAHIYRADVPLPIKGGGNSMVRVRLEDDQWIAIVPNPVRLDAMGRVVEEVERA